MGGGETREKFFQKTHELVSKKCWKKIVWKKCENTFFYKHKNIVTKKRGKKREKIFFPETHVYRELKTMEKNRVEKVRKHVFYKHTNIVTKKWGGGENPRKFFSRNPRIYRTKKMKKI